MLKTGAKIVIDGLLAEDVQYIFGIPGGAVLPIFDELYHRRQQLKFILVRHEQAAGFMADGYARSSGKPGVCIVTSGPGATNLTTAIATAYTDSIPLVVITGQVATSLIGNDSFQEADTIGITRGITKYNFLVKDVNQLATVMRSAFYLATTGRPGPVIIDIPLDVQLSKGKGKSELIMMRGYNPHYVGHIVQIKKAAKLINRANKPLIYAGGGIITAGATDVLAQLATTIQAPVTTTLMGLGAISACHSLSLGMPGMYGNYIANRAFQECDVVLAIGVRFDNRVVGIPKQFAPKAKIIHIDIDPCAITKIVRTDIPIVGDVKKVLIKMLQLLEARDHAPWLQQLRKWEEKFPPLSWSDHQLHAPYIIKKIAAITNGEAIIVTDVGQHQMWAAQHYPCHFPRHFISSGGHGTMGFGLPAAIGAKFANPTKKVILITGDGSFPMSLGELAVLAINQLDIKIVLFQNGFLGMPRQWQELFFAQHLFGVDLNTADGTPKPTRHSIPDFCALVKTYGINSVTIKQKAQVLPTLKKHLLSNKACLINCPITRLDGNYPFIPPHHTVKNTIHGGQS